MSLLTLFTHWSKNTEIRAIKCLSLSIDPIGQRLFTAPLPPNFQLWITHMVGYHCSGLRKSTVGQK